MLQSVLGMIDDNPEDLPHTCQHIVENAVKTMSPGPDAMPTEGARPPQVLGQRHVPRAQRRAMARDVTQQTLGRPTGSRL